ncbi:hypothetical protein [Chitinophaga sp. sic0106]|uniref:hypothetical protein n=1 Tax=Chitinophaga sp. sic0106 TaxID=2854785 RepID=UPI001C444DE5|nr:hypothetical protein [Chitinophaga sp. sic0106]MBV7530219.1 hypothetical protein [Chitinophaga sp. sic0106]
MTEKPLKIILYIILGVCVISFVMTVFGNSALRGAREDIKAAKRSADSAITELKKSQDRVDSINADMDVLKQYASNIRKFVELSDQQKVLEETRSAAEKKRLKDHIDSLRNEIKKDSLPVIEVSVFKTPK